MTIMPHNHQMWTVIGMYTGRFDIKRAVRRFEDANQLLREPIVEIEGSKSKYH